MCKLTKLQVIDNKIIALNEERVAFVFEECKLNVKYLYYNILRY